MLPDSPTPPDEPSHVFAETRASTLAKAANAPIAPELLAEFAASQNPQTDDAPEPAEIETPTPPQPAENPALALTFAPAPDAPFQSSVTVGVQCQRSGAAIHYTLDGTAPDQTCARYDEGKILLTQSATLSARAFHQDQSGPLQSADYVVSKPLWEAKEPADQTDAVAHQTSENLDAPDLWRQSAASVRGKLHAHRALWREDWFALGNVGNWSIAIVSDGAGSAPLSRVGSRLACERAMESLRASLSQIETLSADQTQLQQTDLPQLRAALIQAATNALQNLKDEAETRGKPLTAFAATLLILVRRAWNDGNLCASLQVGDGAIALDCASGLKMLGEADHGQHSSETRFLTTGGVEASLAGRVKFSLPTDLRATLIVSDGVSDDYFPENKRLIEVFDAVKPLAHSANDAGVALLNWLGYEKKGSSDDRTLVLSWPAASEPKISAPEAGSSTSEAGVPTSEAATPTSEAATSTSEAGVATLETELSTSEAATSTSEAGVATLETELSTSEAATSTSEAGVATLETELSTSEVATPTSEAGVATSEAGSATSKVELPASEAGVATFEVAMPASQAEVASAQPNAQTAEIEDLSPDQAEELSMEAGLIAPPESSHGD